MVSDQKPLTGGIWPLSKCRTYFFEAASKSLPLAVLLPSRIDRVLWTIGAQTDGGDERSIQIVGAVYDLPSG